LTVASTSNPVIVPEALPDSCPGHQPPALADVTAAILAGGLGTRLQPVVNDCPKVLAPVMGRPYLTFLLDHLAAASIRRVVLLTGYRAEQVSQALGKSYQGMQLIYSVEPCPLGTGGAVRWALAQLLSPTVLLLNGDSYCGVDLAHFWTFHDRQAADLSLVAARAADATRFGRLRFASDGAVRRFLEKSRRPCAGWINAGMYLLRRDLIAAFPRGRSLSLESDLIPAWIKDWRVYGFRSRTPFLDIGTPSSYAAADKFFAGQTDRAPSRGKGQRTHDQRHFLLAGQGQPRLQRAAAAGLGRGPHQPRGTPANRVPHQVR
jgi:NDP-sugar pyrophosphorylase family protein